MIDEIKNRRFSLLFPGIAATTVFRIAIPFYRGYYGNGFDILVLCTEPVRYILMVFCAIAIIASTVTRKQKLFRGLALIFFVSFGLVPAGHFMTLGALLSIHNANPTQIRDDARILMDELGQPTHFTNDVQQRVLVGEFVPKARLPQSLQAEVFNDVLVMDDKVFIEKIGLCCLFRGFVVFREGSDVWKNEKPIKLLDGCADCWRIRVIDGLYWYHAVPTEEEITTVFHPLK